MAVPPQNPEAAGGLALLSVFRDELAGFRCECGVALSPGVDEIVARTRNVVAKSGKPRTPQTRRTAPRWDLGL